MFRIEFYEKDGKSELYDFYRELSVKSEKSKDARIQHKQFALYIQLLSQNGTNLPSGITKHLAEDIWELRPGNNRVLYFFCMDNTFVLLHHFRKKTQKTPKSEIQKAKAERDDYLSRRGK